MDLGIYFITEDYKIELDFAELQEKIESKYKIKDILGDLDISFHVNDGIAIIEKRGHVFYSKDIEEVTVGNLTNSWNDIISVLKELALGVVFENEIDLSFHEKNIKLSEKDKGEIKKFAEQFLKNFHITFGSDKTHASATICPIPEKIKFKVM